MRNGWPMPKITCEVSQSLLNEIKKIEVDGDFKSRGAVVEYLVDLALQNPNHSIDDFGPQSEEECFLKISAENYELTKEYRSKFLLTKKRHFLNHALRHGVTIHKDVTTPTTVEADASPVPEKPKRNKK